MATKRWRWNGSAWVDITPVAFSTIAVSGQTDVTADSSTDTLTLVAGTGVAITTTPGTDSVEFAIGQSVATSATPTFAKMLLGDGTAGSPSLQHTADTNSGINFPSADVVEIVTAGTARLTAAAGGGITVATGPLDLPDGAVGTPSLTNTGDLNTGLYFPAADEVALSAGGALKLKALSAGVEVTGTIKYATSNRTGLMLVSHGAALCSAGHTAVTNTTPADITGCTTGALSLVAGDEVFVWGSFDADMTVAGVFLGTLDINGTAQTPWAAHGPLLDRIVVSQTWKYTVPSTGSYTFKLRRQCSAGTYTIRTTGTTLTWQVFSSS
jgi:hypothetical protein